MMAFFRPFKEDRRAPLPSTFNTNGKGASNGHGQSLKNSELVGPNGTALGCKADGLWSESASALLSLNKLQMMDTDPLVTLPLLPPTPR